jgi:hypothetical protein
MSEDTHLELMVYHLQMAYAHFLNAPNNNIENAAEVNRLMLAANGDWRDAPEVTAAQAWLTDVFRTDEEARARD